ncbi:hypothetical protein ACTMTI_54615 [Nonomuraea sp. H19]|uniref:hypothetical protein n=1 Tax=Nonomuraea sp. H19 TaxID=3452206 RepID=UPI003F8BC9C9
MITRTTEYYGKAIGELRDQSRDVGDELLSFIAPATAYGWPAPWAASARTERSWRGPDRSTRPVTAPFH